MPIIFGIDPGFTGAIARLQLAPDMPWLDVADMPLTTVPPDDKKLVDGKELRRIFSAIRSTQTIAILEKVGSRPNQGVVSTFTFGKNYGIVIGVLQALDIPTLYTPPGVWKSTLNLSSDKKLSREKAMVAFPNHAHYFARSKDDGRAEAALLALFGAQRILPSIRRR